VILDLEALALEERLRLEAEGQRWSGMTMR
jgi:hypothetical protein